MAKDVGDAIGAAIGHAAREVAQTVSANAHKATKKPLAGGRGIVAGAGLAALVPLAAKGAGKVVRGIGNGAGPLQAAGERVSDGVQDAVGKSVEKAGGAGGLAKEAGKARDEGRDYVVQDGDVMLFKFNV